MNNYNFPVTLTPIISEISNQQIPNRSAVLRTDTNKVLGIVSGKYELLKHETVVDSFREALVGEVVQEKISMKNDGAYLFASYKLENHILEVQKGDLVSLQFIVKNSYNGTNSLQIIVGAFRLVCENGMIIGKEFFSFSQKHIVGNGIEIDVLKKNIGQLTEQFKNTLPVMQKMTKKLPVGSSPLFENEKIYLPKYILELAKESYFSSDLTVWSYYNSLTAAITHSMKKENPAAQIDLGKNAWELALKQI